MTNKVKVFYTADLHIDHRLVASIRGFTIPGAVGDPRDIADTGAHNRAIALEWDSRVGPNDHVFILGDISINGSERVLEWVSKRPGFKHLISGNHDPVHPAHRNSYKLYDKWMSVFASIQPFLRKRLVGKEFLMSHFPYSGTGAEGHGVEDRFTQYRLPDMGMPLLHGHTHGPELHHVSDNGSPQLHVGLDAWNLKLVEQEKVMEWLEEHVH